MIVLFTIAWKAGGMRFSWRELSGRGIPQGVLALAFLAVAAVLVRNASITPLALAVPLAAFVALCLWRVLSRQEVEWIRAGFSRALPEDAGGKAETR